MKHLPTLSGQTGLHVLLEMLRKRSALAGLEAMRIHLGVPFRITLPGFSPVIVSGPELNRQVLVTDREKFRWRTESDPVTSLLRHGVLVEDGESHDRLRALMDPSLQRTRAVEGIAAMWRYTDRVLDRWPDSGTVDMLVEMRVTALLILMGVLFGEDVEADLDRIWDPILKSIAFISPGAWIAWPGIPRPGYAGPLAELDAYLYGLIARRRAAGAPGDDLLSALVREPGLDDGAVRDQLLTMLIAGHDTSTALLAWALHLLGGHPAALRRSVQEVDQTIASLEQPPTAGELRGLKYLDAVIKETMRLYPPIHIGSRRTAEEIELAGCPVGAGTRVMYSIYLTHRDPAHWPEPGRFLPERFLSRDAARPAMAYVPFGGGPRSCIGAAFSLVEARVVLARVLQRFDLEPVPADVRPHMGATLEPRPGVPMIVTARGRTAG